MARYARRISLMDDGAISAMQRRSSVHESQSVGLPQAGSHLAPFWQVGLFSGLSKAMYHWTGPRARQMTVTVRISISITV